MLAEAQRLVAEGLLLYMAEHGDGLHISREIVEAILDGSGVQARLLIALLMHQNDYDLDDDDPIRLSLTQLSKLARMHRQSVVRAVDEAERQGLLRVERSTSGNTYYLQ